MNFLKKIGNALKKFFGAGKEWYVRLGLGKFFDAHIPTALAIISKLATVNTNKEFKDWYQEAFDEFKKITGETKGTWIAIVLNAAYELSKAANAKPENKEKV